MEYDGFGTKFRTKHVPKLKTTNMSKTFKGALQRLQGKSPVPSKVLQMVHMDLTYIHGIKNPSIATIDSILKKYRVMEYFDSIPYILMSLDYTLVTPNILPERECPVCFEEASLYKQLVCNHSFCLKCVENIKTMGNVTCPLCRKFQKAPVKYCLTEEEADIMMKEFDQCYEEYASIMTKINANQVVKMIAEKHKINLPDHCLFRQ